MSVSVSKRELAVIGFSSAASPLEPAWPSTHRALLPVAGKPIIIHLIEQLAALGIKHLRIAGSIQQFPVKNRLGTGQEFGVTIRYSDIHGPDLCLQTLLERRECLYFIGDQLLNVAHALDSLNFARARTSSLDSTESAALWTLGKDGPECLQMNNPFFAKGACIKTASDFHLANKLLVTGTVNNFELPGRAIREHVQVGWDSNIHPTAEIEAGVTVGNQCYIGSRVYLGAGCVIGDGCVIRPGAQLINVSLLPNTFVGGTVQLRDAIITPKAIFDLHGKYWLIDDRSIISRVRSNDEANTGMPTETLSEIEQVSKANHSTNLLRQTY